MIELTERRSLRAKVFDLGGRKRRVIASLAPLHVPADPAAWQRGEPTPLEDDDLSTDPDGNDLTLRRAWYALRVSPDLVGYAYRSRRTGATLAVHLRRIGATVIVGQPVPTIRREGNQLWWDNVVPGVDIYLQLRVDGVEIFKRIRTSSAPRQFVWRIRESLPLELLYSTVTHGVDNADRSNPTRLGSGPDQCRRELRILSETGPEDTTTAPGFRIYDVTETWTGQIILRDPVTRAPSLSSAVSYPVLIDFDVSEVIAADADDGHQRSIYWYTGSLNLHKLQDAATNLYPGYRFQTVAVPQGATIDLATFRVTISFSGGGAGGAAVLYGRASDDAPVWGTSAGPNEMVRTTASVAFGPWGGSTSGAQAYDVTAIVQEIVNRAGWATGSDMAFAIQGALTGGGYSYMHDLMGGSTNAAKLEIDYTEAGGGGDPEGSLIGGKLLRGGLLMRGVLVH